MVVAMTKRRRKIPGSGGGSSGPRVRGTEKKEKYKQSKVAGRNGKPGGKR